MGAKKLFDFLSKKQPEQKIKKFKVVERVVEKKSEPTPEQKNEDKVMTKQLIEVITKKMSDPEMAKKAAMILAQMIDQNKK